MFRNVKFTLKNVVWVLNLWDHVVRVETLGMALN